MPDALLARLISALRALARWLKHLARPRAQR
jgi:hypothetical protein